MASVYIDRLKAVQSELDSCVKSLEKDPSRFGDRVARMRYKPAIPVRVAVDHIGGTTSRHQVVAFDLSESGIGFFHGSFVYPDSPCDVHLVTLDREYFSAPAAITRCIWVEGSIHFIAAEFKKPIDIGQFLHIEAPKEDVVPPEKILEKPETLPSLELCRSLANHLALLSHHPVLWNDARHMMIDLENLIDGRETRLPTYFYERQDHIALVDKDAIIRAVNPYWCHFAANNGYEGNGFTGTNYVNVLNKGEKRDPAVDGIYAVLRGEVPEYSAKYTCHNHVYKLWYKLRVRPFEKPPGFSIEHQLIGRTPNQV